MVGLQAFIDATNNVTGNASLTLTNQQMGVSIRSNWRARCIERFRTRQNRDVATGFLNALNQRYGKETADVAARSIRLDRTRACGKPLRVRQVTIATRQAEQQAAETRQRNRYLADYYVINLHFAYFADSALRSVIDDAARTGYGGNADVAGLLDYPRLAQTVSDAIIAEGKDGEVGCRSIEQNRADEICEEIVNQQLRDAYNAAKARALQKLDPRVAGSFTHRELVRALVELGTPGSVADSGISPDAAEHLCRRFASSIDSGDIRPDELVDDGALQSLARDVVAQFKKERKAALERLGALSYVDDAERKAFLAQVSRDTVSPILVSCLAFAHEMLCERLSCLTSALPPEELHSVIAYTLLSIQSAWDNVGIEVTADNEQRLYRETWRFLLAPLPPDMVESIYGHYVAGDGPARRIGEAASWYATEFGDSPEAARTYEDTEGRVTLIHGEDSFKLARGYSNMLSGLAAVLHEKISPRADQAPPMRPLERPGDQTVATLRNLGIPFPAPDRLDCAAVDVPLSEPAMVEMRSEFAWHIQACRKVVRNGNLGAGMTKNFMDFLAANEQVRQQRRKACFRVDGVDLPGGAGTSAVVDALRRFCMDDTDGVDEKLLTRISQAASPETLRCVYAACMDPRRPDLAILNGYPRGVYEEHSYSLSKEEDGAVRLKITERITPLFFHPVKHDTVIPDSGTQLDVAVHPPAKTLSGQDSEFKTEVLVSFGDRKHPPEIDQVKISYRLTPCEPQAPYWIRSNSSPVDAHSESVEAERSDSFEAATTQESDHIYDRLYHGFSRRQPTQPSAVGSFNNLAAEPGPGSLR